MNRQEIYDKVKNHLLTQNAKAQDLDDTCVYLAEDGMKCAAGCLISDGLYNTNLENHVVGLDPTGVVASVLVASGVPPEALPLVQRLQQVHDTKSSTTWAENLARIAVEYGLTP